MEGVGHPAPDVQEEKVLVNHEEICFLELTEVAELIRSRQISASEVLDATLQRIADHDQALGSYVTVMGDVARAAAATADKEISRGNYKGLLHGIPLGIKDLCYTTDAVTAAGMPIFNDFTPPHDATVVTRFRDAGAVMVGKLKMTEGAYTEHHPQVTAPVNPWDAETWAGVSSSGSGVAVAAGLCFGATGSDTGGSIRLPSSMNGVTGLKPTWGRVSRYGVVELGASLDHVGPMARSARDCAALLEVMAGADPNDPTASLEPVPSYAADLSLAAPPRIGVDWTAMASFDETTRQMLVDTVVLLESLGWPVVELRLPDLGAISEAFGPLLAVETALAHEATFPSRAAEYGQALGDFIEAGRASMAVDYQKLVKQRMAFVGEFRRVFQKVDLVLMPGVGFASPTLEKLSTLGEDMELFAALLTPTAPFNMTGSPTITLPAGFSPRGTPLGVQFIGRDFSEQLLLQAGHAFQSVTDFHTKHPPLAQTARQLERAIL